MAFGIPTNPAMDSTNKFMGGLSSPTPATGGGIMPPTSSATPLPATPLPTAPIGGTRTPNMMDSIIPQANASQEFDNTDVSKFRDLVGKGVEPERAKSLILQSKGTQPQEAPKPDEPGMLSKIGSGINYVGQGIQNVVGGAIAEVPQIAGNVLGLASDIGGFVRGQSSEERNAASDLAKGIGKKGSEFVQKYGAYDPNSIGAKVGGVGTDIAATLVGTGKIFKTLDTARIAIKGLAGLANATIDGTTAAVQNYAATEGRLPTADEVKNFIITGGVIKGAGKVAGVLSTIPTSRIVPTTISEAGRDLQKGLDIGKTIRDTGISVSKTSLMSKIDAKVKGLSSDVDAAIQTVVKEKGPSNVKIKDITAGLKDKIMNNPEYKRKLQGTPIDAADIKDGIQETIDSYNKLYKGKAIPLPDQQQLKQDIYSGLAASFKKADTAKLSARQVTEKEIAKTLKEGLEEKVPEIKSLNQQLAPLLEASGRLKAKGSYSSYLTDIIAGGFAAGNPTAILQDPVGFAKNFLIGVAVKRAGTSTLAKTTTATALNNINKLFENPVFIRTIQDRTKSLYSNQK